MEYFNRSEIAVMTSLEFQHGDMGPHGQVGYRNLTWEELASRNQYYSDITSVDDMMRRFEERADRIDRDIRNVCN